MNTLTLYLVRHGQTEANRTRHVQGQNDTALTAAAEGGIRAVADKLRGLDPALDPAVPIYCSTLGRARDTLTRLRAYLGLTANPSHDARLMEIHFGRHTGRPVADMLETITHHKHHPTLAYPGGESSNDIRDRVVASIADIQRSHPGETVLMVTHFGVIETAIRHYLELPPSHPLQPSHQDVHRLTWEPDQPPIWTVF